MLILNHFFTQVNSNTIVWLLINTQLLVLPQPTDIKQNILCLCELMLTFYSVIERPNLQIRHM